MSITLNTVDTIRTEQALRHIVPSYPKMLDKRIQSSLDHFSLEFINVARIAFIVISSQEGVMLPLLVHSALKVGDNTHFIIDEIENTYSTYSGNTALNASLYFMAPGLGHGLRINGTLLFKNATHIFKIEQVYFHCSRAAARAGIWTSKSSPIINKNNLIEHCPFLLLKTMNSERHTEISPRGDESGFVKVISKDMLLLPERPGNKIAVSLRNILVCSNIELLLIVPGFNKTLNIKGKAMVISDQKLLKQCTVNGKTPKIGMLINIESTHFNYSMALGESGIWETKNAIEKSSITSFSKALSAHINGTGLLGKATNAIVGAVVKHDMQNLY
jgi:predicted pyridoxine 5'-phosphate oxidase superfamily flavin-nucleotide-binding protein